MLKGIFRLAVVLTVLSWIGTTVFHWYELESAGSHPKQHLPPRSRGKHSDTPPSRLSWPVNAASEEFISLPAQERRAKADDFYDSSIKHWESFYFMDG